MYDKTLIIDGLRDIEEALFHIIDRTKWITKAEDFVVSPKGMDILDVVTISTFILMLKRFLMYCKIKLTRY